MWLVVVGWLSYPCHRWPIVSCRLVSHTKTFGDISEESDTIMKEGYNVSNYILKNSKFQILNFSTNVMVHDLLGLHYFDVFFALFHQYEYKTVREQVFKRRKSFQLLAWRMLKIIENKNNFKKLCYVLLFCPKILLLSIGDGAGVRGCSARTEDN